MRVTLLSAPVPGGIFAPEGILVPALTRLMVMET
jgi:hypothetical protein